MDQLRKFVLLLLLSTFGSMFGFGQQVEIRGVYGNPKPLWDQGVNLGDLGVNAVFVHSGAINQDMVARARDEGLKIYAEFATLNGKNYVEEHPEAWAIDEKGQQVEPASWFMGVCPTEPGFRKYRFDQLRDLLQKYQLDGVWMDYVHWHAQFEDPDPILPETCFNDPCLSKFSRDTGIDIPNGTTDEKAKWILEQHDTAWRNWRCQVIVEWAVEIRVILEEIRPGALLGLYHCPWTDDEYQGARRRNLGLDYDLLAEVIDVFSPMVYHGRMERTPDWVGENVIWLGDRLKTKKNQTLRIWPIVQAYNDPGEISAEEFEQVLRAGLSGKASGVMMFTTYAVAEDKQKIEVMKQVYRSLSK
jgi:hypothetical protein